MDDYIDAEEVFGISKKKKKNAPVRRSRTRGKGADKDLLAELKLKMVMRIYNVSRARAAAIIAGRAGERQALEEVREAAREARRARCLNGDETMTAEDFFNL